MANYSVSAAQLTEGARVFIRGRLAYAQLTRPIEGNQLAASDQRKVQNGMSPVGMPHTTATITNAEVQFADPANPTVEEQFVSERRYDSKKSPDTGANYSIDSKGSNLPIIAIPAAASDGTFDQDTSGRELARDLDVTLVLRVYKPQKFNNRGLALEQVIVHEAPRYYNPGVDTAELAARGIVLNTPPRVVQAPVSTSAVGAAEDAVGTETEDDLSFPAPMPATAPAQAAEVQGPTAASAAPAPVPAAQPQAETLEQKLARLEAENKALKNAGSALSEPVPVGVASASPWNGQSGEGHPQAGITYQG
jgi:hypothetical protein